ncbi:hypothetical protein DMC63_37780 [Streptomyces sp. WAC 05977]|nr:hypothetical protein DMC63_37780 [Streptomyces sp. WAC 05977]
MTEAAAQESAPEVWPMLRAWAEEIRTEPFSDAVSLESLREAWNARRRSLAATLAEDSASGDAASPAWVPDETWPLSYEHTQRLQHHGRIPGWHPPTAA